MDNIEKLLGFWYGEKLRHRKQHFEKPVCKSEKPDEIHQVVNGNRNR